MRLLITTLAAALLLGSVATQNVAPAFAADQKEAKESSATFEVYQDKGGEYRWRLKAGNGQTIATSGEGYSQKSSCLSAIESVKRAAAEAKIEEK
jgi:uncharacterized protein YegP (UPF0339 family)